MGVLLLCASVPINSSSRQYDYCTALCRALRVSKARNRRSQCAASVGVPGSFLRLFVAAGSGMLSAASALHCRAPLREVHLSLAVRACTVGSLLSLLLVFEFVSVVHSSPLCAAVDIAWCVRKMVK